MPAGTASRIRAATRPGETCESACGWRALRNDDGVARLELDVLSQILPLHDLVVVEREGDLLAVLVAENHDFRLLRVLRHAARGGNELQHGGGDRSVSRGGFAIV